MIGSYCMVRSKSAGVFAGTITDIKGQETTLTNARRIFYWEGAATLSELASRGTSKPEKCKFPAPVDEVIVFETIEIIRINNVAAASIASVPVWSE